jgi:hypothetical protein
MPSLDSTSHGPTTPLLDLLTQKRSQPTAPETDGHIEATTQIARQLSYLPPVPQLPLAALGRNAIPATILQKHTAIDQAFVKVAGLVPGVDHVVRASWLLEQSELVLTFTAIVVRCWLEGDFERRVAD